MEVCKIVSSQTFYQATERITIDSPVEGIVYSDNPNITVVPQVVKPGLNQVVAIRNGKLVTVEAGETVGLVLPFAQPAPELEPEKESTVATEPESRVGAEPESVPDAEPALDPVKTSEPEPEPPKEKVTKAKAEKAKATN